MHIFNSPDHQYACALENSRMMQARLLKSLQGCHGLPELGPYAKTCC